MDTLLAITCAIPNSQARRGAGEAQFRFAPAGPSALVAKATPCAGVPNRRPPRRYMRNGMCTSPWRRRRCCGASAQQLGKPCRSMCSHQLSCRWKPVLARMEAHRIRIDKPSGNR